MAEGKKEIKKGKAFVYTTTGNFVPINVLQKAEKDSEEKQTDSKQLKEYQKWFTQSGLITPPYPPESFLRLYESCAVFAATVGQIAQDVAGLGYTISVKPDKKETKSELEKITNFIEKPNEDDCFREIIKQLIIDWGSVGWFGLEVVRNLKKEITAIYRVAAHTLKVHKSKNKFCQIRNNKKAWFKNFGYKRNITLKEGKATGAAATKLLANELIYYKNFYPKSDYYGVPKILPAVGDVVGLINARDYNLSFFENYGIPAAIVELEGEWESGTDQTIRSFIDTEIKGTDNAHRTLILQIPEEGKFKWTPLTTKVNEKESSFKIYQKDLRENVLMAYSMPPERIGIRIVGKLGGNVAEEATKIYIQGVVEPLQEDIENIINQKLIQEGLQCFNYVFKFNDVDLRDYSVIVDRLVKQIGTGMKTPNEARSEIGLKPYPEGNKFFIGSSLIEIGELEEE